MTGKEILEKEFERSGMRGYRAEQVDVFLQKVAVYVDEQENIKNDLTYKMQILADKIEEYKKDEENIRDALLGAQKLGASILNEAKSKAEVITREAKTTSDDMLLQAKVKVDSMMKESLQKTNLELDTLHHECDKEQKRLESIKQEVSNFRASLLKQYKQHLDLLSNLPTTEETSETKHTNSYLHGKEESSLNKKSLESQYQQKTDKFDKNANNKKDSIAKSQTISSEIISAESDIDEEEKGQTKEFGQEKKETSKNAEQVENTAKSDATFARRASRPNYIEKFGELKFGGFNDNDKK